MSYIDIAEKLGFKDRDAVIRSYNRYTKLVNSGDPVTPEDFILSEIPAPGSMKISSIVAQLPVPLPNAFERLRRLAMSFHYPVTDTIAGYTLQKRDAVTMEDWLRKHSAIKPVWETYCKNNELTASPAEYQRFLKMIKRKYYTVCRYHPCLFYEEFVIGTEADVLMMIQIAYADENEVTTLGYMSTKLAAFRLGISESVMEAWLSDHPNRISTVAGVPFIKVSDVEALESEWKRCVDAEHYDWLHFQGYLDEGAYKRFHSRVMSVLQTELEDLQLPAKAYPQQNNRKIYFAPDKIHLVERALLYESYLVPVSVFDSIPYISVSYLRIAIKQGRLDGAIINQSYYLRPYQVLDYRAKIKMYIPVEAAVRQALLHIHSDFDADRKPCWDELLRFCNDATWWGIWHEEQDAEEVLFDTKYSRIYMRREDVDDLCHALEIWLKIYGKKPAEEFEARLDIHKRDFPFAVRALKKAFPNSDSRTVSVCEMLDMLFYLLTEKRQDIHILAKSKVTIENMIDRMRAECSIAACTNFVEFLDHAGYFNGDVIFNRASASKDVSAYPVENFAVIASTICSQDVWREQDLVRKAVQNPQYAQLWLYVAVHVFSALRSTDYARLMAPVLDEDPDEVLAQIETGTFPVERAQNLSIRFVSLNHFFARRAQKTENTKNVIPLYFHVPADCETEFGTILAIAVAHYTRTGCEGNFLIPSTNLTHQKAFFGTPFVEACNNTAFSGRRANKALMQLVSFAAQEELALSLDIAYAIASSLRSHKGGYARLSETSYRYLNNSSFSGLDGAYVISHMFRRGSCSFIIDHMLKTYFKDQYQDLPIHLQTEAIQKLGLSAHESSEIEVSVKTALLDGESTVKELVSSAAESGIALSNLVAGKARAKDSDAECLLKALGKPCAKDSYQYCAGCKYEIRHKTQYVQYYMEYMRLTQNIADIKTKIENLERCRDLAVTRAKRNAFDSEIAMQTRCLKKNFWLRKTVIHPCLVEIGSHIRSFADKRILESYDRLQKSLTERGDYRSGISASGAERSLSV